MNGFTSFKEPIQDILTKVMGSHLTHAKWLNTLSFLENCGARKIAACEHETLVKEEVLKHAAEEFRHAHYLKRQIGKIWPPLMLSYSRGFILGGTSTLHYLRALDTQISLYLKSIHLSKPAIKEAAYLLVTYAIELRAEELYYLYDAALRKANSPVAVKSILLEEKGHLSEMKEGLLQLTHGTTYMMQASCLEGALCSKWLRSISKEINT